MRGRRHPEDTFGRRAAAYALACIVAAVIVMVCGFTGDALADYRSGKAAGGIVLVMAGLAAEVAITIAIFTLIPAILFLTVARRRGWRHPAIYALFGTGLSGITTWMALFSGELPEGDGPLVVGLVLGGFAAGLVYWAVAVRPLRGSVEPPTSAP